jgi:hypothetical protein
MGAGSTEGIGAVHNGYQGFRVTAQAFGNDSEVLDKFPGIAQSAETKQAEEVVGT